jgi:putative tryptophan/tyrosine transport system substrate-binding protein
MLRASSPICQRDAASELANMPVDVIVTPAEPPARVAREVTQTVPIVMARSLDPVGQGLAASVARPGGSVTGQTVMGVALAPKRVELLKEAVPTISRVAFLWDGLQPAQIDAVQAAQQAGKLLGVELQNVEIRTQADYRDALDAAAREHMDAVQVIGGPFIDTHRTEIVDLTNRNRLASIGDEREWAGVGGLMAYGPTLAAFYRGAATYVDKILKGARPAELPIEQPREFDFVINLRTAQALGLTIPHHVLLQATEVIQ